VPNRRWKFTGTLEGVDGVFSGTIEGGRFVGGQIEIGSGNNVFKASSQGIWAGHADFNSAPFRVDMTGHMVATDGEFSGEITASSFVGGTITGALIRTRSSGYPRIEFSASQELIQAMASSDELIRLAALSAGTPALIFQSPSGPAILFKDEMTDSFNILTREVNISAPGGLYVNGIRLA